MTKKELDWADKIAAEIEDLPEPFLEYRDAIAAALRSAHRRGMEEAAGKDCCSRLADYESGKSIVLPVSRWHAECMNVISEHYLKNPAIRAAIKNEEPK